MSKALKCDRCRKLYEPYDGIKFRPTSNPYNTLRLTNNYIGAEFDMCPECMEKVIEFIKAGKEEEENDQS